MTTFVLIHGSGQNASSWRRVGPLLEARGHEVLAPDLPKEAADWQLADHAAFVAERITEPGVVVVAHSFSGVFLPLIARLRDCAHLVYFAAIVPEPGKSVRDQFTADSTMFCPGWIEAGPRWFDPDEVEGLAREYLFHDCDEPTLRWGLESIEFYDTRRLVTEPSPEAAPPAVPASYVVASDDRTISPEWGRQRARRALGVEPDEIAAGHCPHVSRPDEVAALLDGLTR